MEVNGRASDEPADERVHLVGVFDVERRVIHQSLDVLHVVWERSARLESEPLVHDERVVFPLLVERVDRLLALRAVGATAQRAQRAYLIGHVIGRLEPAKRLGVNLRVLQVGEEREARVLEGPRRAGLAVALVLFRRVVPHRPQELLLELLGEGLDDEIASRVDDVGVGGDDHLGELPFRGQSHGARDERLVGALLLGEIDDVAHGVDDRLVHDELLALTRLFHEVEEERAGEGLAGFPAVELVRVVGHEEDEILLGEVGAEPDGRAEVAEDRRHRLFRDVGEHESLRRLGEPENLGGLAGCPGFALEGELHVAPVAREEADRDGHEHRLLVALTRGRRRGLRAGHGERLGRRVVLGGHVELGRASLGIPGLEGCQVGAVSVGHRGEEIVAGDRLSVVPLEVEVHSLPESVLTEQGLVHADDLGSLFVHRDGVEVIHLDVGFRSDGVRHRPGVLGKLRHAEPGNVADALHAAAVHVCAEFLVAVHGQALLQGQLEPVAAGDAVAGPVVKVLVSDDPLDRTVVHVRRRLRSRQHQPAVEDVQRLVFHRAHVEVVHGDDVEQVQVVLQAEHVFIPLHALNERYHGPVRFIEVVLLDVDAKRNLAPGLGGELILDHAQVTGDQGEEVGGLWEGVLPDGEVLAAVEVAGVYQVAVGEEHGVLGLVRGDPGGELGHDVGPVLVERDPAESLRLALRAEVAGGLVESLQLGVLLGLDLGGDLELEGCGGRRSDGEPLFGEDVRGRVESGTVDFHAGELHGRIPVKEQRPRVSARRERGLDGDGVSHDGDLLAELEIEDHLGEPVVRGCVVLEVDWLGSLGDLLGGGGGRGHRAGRARDATGRRKPEGWLGVMGRLGRGASQGVGREARAGDAGHHLRHAHRVGGERRRLLGPLGRLCESRDDAKIGTLTVPIKHSWR